MMDDKLTAFGRALRVRRRVFLWITAAGLLGLAVCLGLLPGSGIPPVALALYRGGSFGILAAGLANLVRACWLLKRPDRWQETRVREVDERQQHIDREASQMAGTALMLLLVVAGFLAAAIDWRLGVLLECFAVAYFLLYLAVRWRLSKKV